MLMVTSWKSASWSATAIVEDCAERGCLKVLKVKNMYQKTFEYLSKSLKHQKIFEYWSESQKHQKIFEYWSETCIRKYLNICHTLDRTCLLLAVCLPSFEAAL